MGHDVVHECDSVPIQYNLPHPAVMKQVVCIYLSVTIDECITYLLGARALIWNRGFRGLHCL